MTILWYFMLAAAAGAVLRYLADFYLPRRGLLVVNIIGSALAGIVLGLAWHQVIDQALTAILLGGFTGSLTTYSTVAVAAAQQQLTTPGKAVRTWVQHVGLSILGCCLSLVVTVTVLSVTAT